MRTIVASVLLSLSASAQCLDWSRPYVLPGANSTVETATYFDDGTGERLYIGGFFSQVGASDAAHVARSNGAGFEPVGAGLRGWVHRLRVLDLGAGPTLYATLSQPDPDYVYRWDGTNWIPLPGVTGFNDLVAFDDGTGPTVYAASGTGGSGRVWRWTGATWQALGAGTFNGFVSSLEVFDGGAGPLLIAGGHFTSCNGLEIHGIARWAGTAWVPFDGGVGNTGPSQGVDAMAAISWQGSPQLVVAGSFPSAGGVAAANVARYDGGVWSPLGAGIAADPSGPISIRDVALVPGALGPEIAVAGFYGFAGAQPVTGIASWNGATWSALGDPLRSFWGSSTRVHAIARPSAGGGFAIGGSFDVAGDDAVANVARWDGSAWRALVEGEALRGDVETSVVHDDGSGARIYVAGWLQTAGGDAVRLVARFDGQAWERVGSNAYTGGAVYALASADLGGGPRLYAGGSFTTIGGTPASRLATWDGVAWTELAGGGASSVVDVLLHDPIADPGALYAAGNFSAIGGVAASRVARFDGTSWTPVGAPPVGISALALFDDGGGPRLYAGGSFTGRIARFDGSAWNLVPQAPTGTGAIRALRAFDDGVVPRLFVGGQFPMVGGVGTYHVASWDGASWTTYGAGATGYTDGSVDVFRVFDDGQGGGAKLYAGGRFASIDTTTGFSVLAYDGAGWQPLVPGGGVAGYVYALDVLDDVEGSSLYAFGQFASTDSAIAHGVARYGRHGLGGCEPVTGATFCAGDGSGAACPCGNTGLAGRGCDNSHATGGALLDALGQANVATDDVTLRVRGASPSGTLLFFQGTSALGGGAGVAFGDGVRCVGGTQVRLGVRTAVAGEARFGASVPGDPSVSSAGHVAGAAARTYQVWYRNVQSFCTPSTFNLSNGLRIRWGQ